MEKILIISTNTNSKFYCKYRVSRGIVSILFLFPSNLHSRLVGGGGGFLKTIFILFPFLILFSVLQNIVSIFVFLFCFQFILIPLFFHSGILKNNVPVSVIIPFLVISTFLYHFQYLPFPFCYSSSAMNIQVYIFTSDKLSMLFLPFPSYILFKLYEGG